MTTTPMNHLTDDDLILHFYGEAAADAPRVDAHLVDCADCRANWQALQDTLRLVDSADAASRFDAPEGFERVMWARVQPHLPSRTTRVSWWSPRVWAPAAGLAAVITVAFVSGRLWPHNGTTTPVNTPAAPDAAAAANARERVLLSALGEHFEQTEQLLVELKNSPDAKHVDMSLEQQTARDLVAAGRLYRVTAAQNGDTQLTDVLDDLERVLVDVAGSPNEMSSHDLKSLRARIEDDSLLFKLRALTTAVREREKTLSTKSARTL
jgi:hypothetical protein